MEPSTRLPQPRGICELVLEAADVPRLERFYLGLGLQVLSREDDRVWLSSGPGSRLGIWPPGEGEHADRGGRHVHFALAVAAGELDAIIEILRGGDAELEGPVEHDGGDRSAYLTDPEGNRVELWDFFHDGDGAGTGVAALAQDDVA